MQKILALVILALGAIVLHAEYPSVMFRTADGREQTIASKGLEISFNSGNMIAQSSGATLTISVSDLKSMSFSDVTTSVTDVLATYATNNTQITVFRTDGTSAGTFSSSAEAEHRLPTGLYIFRKANGETSKVAIK